MSFHCVCPRFQCFNLMSGKVWPAFSCRMLPIAISRRLPVSVVEQSSSDGDHGTARSGSWRTARRFALERRWSLFSLQEGRRVLNPTFLGSIHIQILEDLTLSRTNIGCIHCQGRKISISDLIRGGALRSGCHKFLVYYYYSLLSLGLYEK